MFGGGVQAAPCTSLAVQRGVPSGASCYVCRSCETTSSVWPLPILMALPLEVLADLQVAIDGEAIDVQANGDRVVVDLPSLRAGRRILAAYPFSSAKRPRSTDRLDDALQIAGLTVEVRLQGETVARIGEEAQPGQLARLLNLNGIEVRPASSLRATARQRPIAATVVIGGLLLLVGWLVSRAWRT